MVGAGDFVVSTDCVENARKVGYSYKHHLDLRQAQKTRSLRQSGSHVVSINHDVTFL